MTDVHDTILGKLSSHSTVQLLKFLIHQEIKQTNIKFVIVGELGLWSRVLKSRVEADSVKNSTFSWLSIGEEYSA